VTTWDEAKRRHNLSKHGVDLAVAARFNFHTAVIREDDSERSGEPRDIAIGWIDDTLYVYVYTLARHRGPRNQPAQGDTEGTAPLCQRSLNLSPQRR
jgi:uncharacterized DUF497 family protein